MGPFSLGEQFAMFFPKAIESVEDMTALATEMKEYARTHPFDYQGALQKARESPDLKVESVGGGVKVTGLDQEIVTPWQRTVTFDGGRTPPYQITYTEGPSPETTGTVQQLVIVAYNKQPLRTDTASFFIQFFWEPGTQLYEGTDLPPHVKIVFHRPLSEEFTPQ